MFNRGLNPLASLCVRRWEAEALICKIFRLLQTCETNEKVGVTIVNICVAVLVLFHQNKLQVKAFMSDTDYELQDQTCSQLQHVNQILGPGHVAPLWARHLWRLE